MTFPKSFYDEMRKKNLDNNFPEGIACGCKYKVNWVEDTKKMFVLIDVKGQEAELLPLNKDKTIKAKLSDLTFVNNKYNTPRYDSVTKPVSVREIKKKPTNHTGLLWEDLADFTANNTLKDSIRYFHLYPMEISDALITAAHCIDREIKNKKLRRKVLDVINCNIQTL